MPIDFGKLGAGNPADTVLSPRDLFAVLPAKAARYQYPRDVQAEVWNAWFQRRDQAEVVVKMNTGSGKTVVGLLMLKSCLNEKKGPAVYVCPDPFLVGQVMQEANDLGIEVTDSDEDPRFLRGFAILVINIYKLVNGKSRFGVGSEGIKVRIGSVVIDDVDACLSTTVGQFTLTIPVHEEAYDRLFALFRDDLARQSESSLRDVEQHYPYTNMLVPFWAWKDKHTKVVQVLSDPKYTKLVEWVWPLIKEHLQLCHCVFGGRVVEISPPFLPVAVIPSFVRAGRKIYMTATLSDDSVLVTHFNASPEVVAQPITPTTANDIGDRMILVPQELTKGVGDNDVKALVSKVSQRHNVVVIVPSNYRAKYWSDVAKHTLTATNLQDGVARLKAGHVGLVVMVNRYDGVDLPQAACRVLVIDGVPDVRRRVEMVEHAALAGSEQAVSQFVQRIEQGMGRGIRSNDDYCVVVLMGGSLIRILYADGALDKFTAATAAQLELSSKLAEQLRGKAVSDLEEIMDYCLKRDRNWVSASRGVLVSLKYDSAGAVSQMAVKSRRAFDAADIRDYAKAASLLQELVNQTQDGPVKGWLKQQLAEYTHHFDPAAAQRMLQSALTVNRFLLRPIEGIAYAKLMTPQMNQAHQCSTYLADRFGDAGKLVIAMNGILDDLIFEPETSSRFEESLNLLAFFLGFKGQRPEKEIGKGPDNLWEVGSLRYFVIEAKNGATTETISKDYCNQLAGSVNWFESNYDSTCSVVPVLIHPSTTFEYACSPPPATRIIDSDRLSVLSEACRRFAAALAANDSFRSPKATATHLVAHKLTADTFAAAFTVAPREKG